MVWIRNVKRILAVHESEGRKKETLLSERKERQVCGIYCREFLLGEGEARLAYIY